MGTERPWARGRWQAERGDPGRSEDGDLAGKPSGGARGGSRGPSSRGSRWGGSGGGRRAAGRGGGPGGGRKSLEAEEEEGQSHCPGTPGSRVRSHGQGWPVGQGGARGTPRLCWGPGVPVAPPGTPGPRGRAETGGCPSSLRRLVAPEVGQGAGTYHLPGPSQGP